MDRLGEIFERQLRLQRESFGVDPAAVNGLDRERYLVQNGLAVVIELAEAINETNWKMWVHGLEPGSFHDRDAFVKECVDIMHFLINLLLLAGCDRSVASRIRSTAPPRAVDVLIGPKLNMAQSASGWPA